MEPSPRETAADRRIKPGMTCRETSRDAPVPPVAKAVYALVIFHVARIKSFDDDRDFAALEASRDELPAETRPTSKTAS